MDHNPFAPSAEENRETGPLPGVQHREFRKRLEPQLHRGVYNRETLRPLGYYRSKYTQIVEKFLSSLHYWVEHLESIAFGVRQIL